MEPSRRIRTSRPLATTAMHGRVDEMKDRGEAVIDFSIAISHFAPPSTVLAAIADEITRHPLPYTAVGGGRQTRAALVQKLSIENGITARPEEIIVTNGAKQALYEALHVLTDPGDRVLVFKPHWPAYVTTACLLGLEPVLVDLPKRITLTYLESLPATKIVIINNPHNPTGEVLARDELELLYAWLRRHGRWAIVDESYEKLLFEGRHQSLAAFGDWREPGIVTLFSASQSYAMMGWRVGFALAPACIVNAMETLQGPITAAASALSQAAARAAFSSGDVPHMITDYQQRRDMVTGMFGAAPWVRMRTPQAGPYLWGDISLLNCDGVTFAENLLMQRKVAVMPGEALGVSNHFRIGYISDDLETLRQGVQEIISFGNELAYSG